MPGFGVFPNIGFAKRDQRNICIEAAFLFQFSNGAIKWVFISFNRSLDELLSSSWVYECKYIPLFVSLLYHNRTCFSGGFHGAKTNATVINTFTLARLPIRLGGIANNVLPKFIPVRFALFKYDDLDVQSLRVIHRAE